MAKDYLDYKTLREFVKVLLKEHPAKCKKEVEEHIVTEIIDEATLGEITPEKVLVIANKWNSKLP